MDESDDGRYNNSDGSFKDDPRSEATCESKTDPDARLRREGKTTSELRYMVHTLTRCLTARRSLRRPYGTGWRGIVGPAGVGRPHRSAANRRNIFCLLFCDPDIRATQADWAHAARSVVAVFRIDVMRGGADAEVMPLVDELCGRSPEFAALWAENSVQSFEGIVKQICHSALGLMSLEYSSFAVDGRSDLAMVVYNPMTDHDQRALRAFVLAQTG